MILRSTDGYFVASSALVKRLSSDREVARIDLDRGGHAADAESLPLIGGDVAHSEGLTGKGVTVAALDTGIDETHPDLTSSLVAEHCFVMPNGYPSGASEQDDPGSARDDHGHGTNVAGIIAAVEVSRPSGAARSATQSSPSGERGRTRTPRADLAAPVPSVTPDCLLCGWT